MNSRVSAAEGKLVLLDAGAIAEQVDADERITRVSRRVAIAKPDLAQLYGKRQAREAGHG